MADVNKTDIQFKASQRLDDTDQGGGQMTSIVIESGAVNNFFADISRLDRVYGRVSLRKGYIAVNTETRVSYYGAHAVLTQETADPNVSVCFYSSKDWFDARKNAKDRMEAYLVQGPVYPAGLWGNHYKGTKNITLFTQVSTPSPVIGDVIVLVDDGGTVLEEKQYVRIKSVAEETRSIEISFGQSVVRKILTISVTDQLLYDFEGEDISVFGFTSTLVTRIYTTVAADASRYYGISKLVEDAAINELQLRVESVNAPLVPSAQSETAITDAGIGTLVTMPLNTDTTSTTVTRTLNYAIASGGKLYIGEGILPGTLNWTGDVTLTDDSKGNVLNGSTIVGSIVYETGVIVFGTISSYSGSSGSVTYVPACSPTLISDSGAVLVDISNRGFTYVFNCEPLPKKGTLRVEYIANGKWYTLKDQGNGTLAGYDPAIGSGQVNFITGSASVTLGALPDIDSYVMFFWAKDAPFYDLRGETLSINYKGTTHNVGITRNTFKVRWGSPVQCIMDNGNGDLVVGTGTDPNQTPSATVVGSIKYATGEYEFGIGAAQTVPLSSENFHFTYSYGDKYHESFNPGRNIGPTPPAGTVSFYLSNTPIKPGTFKIVWHTDQEEYDGSSGIRRHIDPTWTFTDNGSGLFKNENGAGITNWVQGSVNYTTGLVTFMPDRVGTFPVSLYMWFNTGLFDPDHKPIKEYKFQQLAYRPAASIWPTDGIIECDYSTVDGANADDYYTPLSKKFFVKATSNLEIVPRSLSIMAGTTYIMDAGNGRLFKSISGTTGVGTEVGTINYVDREVVINDDTITSRSITIRNCTGTAAIDPVNMFVFRAPAAPVRNGSLGIRATMGTGDIISGNSDLSGIIAGTYVKGTIDYTTGICKVAFGSWVTDTWSALPVEDQPEWYPGAVTNGAGSVWKPISVRASTVLINCVVTSYIPLDATLLGLDPVRLPVDGKVPIFRDGYIVLVHNTQNEQVTITAPGALPAISRYPVDLIEIYDSNGKYWPDGGNYSVNLNTGVITILPTYSLPAFDPDTGAGYLAPMKAVHRIEDMAIASDVQVTGHIAITTPLTHNYPADESFVSSVLPIGDLQSRGYNEFEQSVWDGIWRDVANGTQPLASFNFVDYPIMVINKTCTKERWLLLFQTSTTVKIVGENLGVLAENVSIVTGNYSPVDGKWLGELGFTGGYIAVKNRNFGNIPYWFINCAGAGSGWAANNGIRFNTDAANFPLWVVRTTLQAPATEPTDSYIMQIRGDSA